MATHRQPLISGFENGGFCFVVGIFEEYKSAEWKDMQSGPTICMQVGGFGFVSYERCTAFVLSTVEKAVTHTLDKEDLVIVN